MAGGAQGSDLGHTFGRVRPLHRRLRVASKAVHKTRVSLRVAYHAVACRPIVVLRELVTADDNRLPALWGMAFGTVIVSPSVHGRRRVTVATNESESGEALRPVALAAIQPGVFANERHRVVERMLGPGSLRRVAAAARHGDAVGTDVARLAVLGAAHPVDLVALLAALARHYAAVTGRLVHGNDATVAAGTSQRRAAVRAVVGSVAHCAIAHDVSLGRGSDLSNQVHVHQAAMTVGATLLVMHGVRHAQRSTNAGLGKRVPRMATQATVITDVGSRWGKLVVGGEMRNQVFRARDVHLQVARQAGFDMAVQTDLARMSRRAPLLESRPNLVTAGAESRLHRNEHRTHANNQNQSDHRAADGECQPVSRDGCGQSGEPGRLPL